MAQRQSSKRESFFRQVDFIFYREKPIRDAIFEKRNIARDFSLSLFPISEAHGNFSDPTASKAIKNVTPLKFVKLSDNSIIHYPEKWLTVIDKTYSWANLQNDSCFAVAKLRYNGEDYRKICFVLHISKSTLHRLLEKVRVYATLQAVQLGLIKV